MAHEPSQGLYVIANHARSAAVPALVAARRTLDLRTETLNDATLDAKYAVQALEQYEDVALPALRAAVTALSQAHELLSTP